MGGNNDELFSIPASPRDHRGAASTSRNTVRALDRWMAKAIFRALGNPLIRLALWDGWEVSRSPDDAVPAVTIRDRGALYKLALEPEFQFGELLTQDRISISGDLPGFLERVYRAKAEAGLMHLPQRLLAWLYKPRSNALAKSRENIHQHYDIGNDFYGNNRIPWTREYLYR